MTRPIIVGTDFSPRAEKALGRAAWLAGRLGRRLRVVHAFRDSAWANVRRLFSEADWTVGDPFETARGRVQELAAALAEQYAVTIDTDVPIGTATQALCAAAEQSDAELLVVGAYGENWRGDAYLGGTAHKLLDEAPCPVLVVRREPEASYERVVVGIDFSAASLRGLALAAAVLPDSRLHVVHALAPLNEAQLRAAGADDGFLAAYHRVATESAERMLAEAIAEHLGEAGQRATTHVEVASPDDLVRTQAGAIGGALAVLGKRGQHAGKPKVGSNLVNVLHHGECDVLVVP